MVNFGVVIPLATRANDTTTTVSDDFLIGFPTGVSIKTSERLSFDLETFSGTVEILTLDRAGTVTASRSGTFRATRVNVRRPSS